MREGWAHDSVTLVTTSKPLFAASDVWHARDAALFLRTQGGEGTVTSITFKMEGVAQSAGVVRFRLLVTGWSLRISSRIVTSLSRTHNGPASPSAKVRDFRILYPDLE